MDGYWRSEISVPTRAPDGLADAWFIPRHYEPNYPYPLLIVFHDRASHERQIQARLPEVSWRNYLALCLRGPESLSNDEKIDACGFGWETRSEYKTSRQQTAQAVDPARSEVRVESESDAPSLPESPGREQFRAHVELGQRDGFDRIETAVFDTLQEVNGSLNYDPTRIFLIGFGEGAVPAYRLGLAHPDRFAGIVAINGWRPRHRGLLRRFDSLRGLPVLIQQGRHRNPSATLKTMQFAELLCDAGLDVTCQSFPTARRVTTSMLAEIDAWLMGHCLLDPSVDL